MAFHNAIPQVHQKHPCEVLVGVLLAVLLVEKLEWKRFLRSWLLGVGPSLSLIRSDGNSVSRLLVSGGSAGFLGSAWTSHPWRIGVRRGIYCCIFLPSKECNSGYPKPDRGISVVEAPLISGAETGICVGEHMSRLVHLQVYHGCCVHAAGVGLQYVEVKPNSISSSYLTDAPFSISNSTVTELPLSEAKCNGVLLSIVRALTDAPFSISNETVFKSPPIDAKCHGVSLSVLRALTDAPFSISKATVSKFPRSDAQCNGV
jgi:hypothetical protein